MTTLYKNLLDQFDRSEVNITKWIAASKEYFQTVIHADPILKQFSNKITIVLHGSTTRNVDTVIAEIKRNPAALSGPEKENRISQELRIIRAKLVDKSKRDGIDELWLEKWWRYIDRPREIVNEVRWLDSN